MSPQSPVSGVYIEACANNLGILLGKLKLEVGWKVTPHHQPPQREAGPLHRRMTNNTSTTFDTTRYWAKKTFKRKIRGRFDAESSSIQKRKKDINPSYPTLRVIIRSNQRSSKSPNQTTDANALRFLTTISDKRSRREQTLKRKLQIHPPRPKKEKLTLPISATG